MNSLGNFLKKIKEKRDLKNSKLSEMQEQIRLNKIVNTRMKTPEERELDKFEEQDRQRQIKKRLEMFREREKKENFGAKSTIINAPNIFKNKDNILKAPNMFSGEKNNMGFFGKSNMMGGFKI